jgi:hypothetical protein
MYLEFCGVVGVGAGGGVTYALCGINTTCVDLMDLE